MKVGGLILLGLVSGMLGGYVVGMALGLAWVELLDTGITPDFFSDSTAGDPAPDLTPGFALEPVRDRGSFHRSYKPHV